MSPPSPEPSVPEITDSDVIVDTHGVALGEGATGKVLSGSYDGKPVALKVGARKQQLLYLALPYHVPIHGAAL